MISFSASSSKALRTRSLDNINSLSLEVIVDNELILSNKVSVPIFKLISSAFFGVSSEELDDFLFRFVAEGGTITGELNSIEDDVDEDGVDTKAEAFRSGESPKFSIIIHIVKIKIQEYTIVYNAIIYLHYGWLQSLLGVVPGSGRTTSDPSKFAFC